MTNFIPIFPLNIVVFPSEQLNLHIFEPRYKQLIQDCLSLQKPFGIPAVINQNMSTSGTLMKIVSVENEHPNGELDIKTTAESIFTILEVVHDIPDKLYKGAIVHYPENDSERHPKAMQQLYDTVVQFHQILGVEKKFKKNVADMLSYDVAHFVGLSLAEEFEFMNIWHEDQRIAYLMKHLGKTIPFVNEMQLLKERIHLNGHFRKLSIDD